MINCPTCTYEVADGLRFCPKCGTRVVEQGVLPDPMLGKTIASNFLLSEVIGVGAMGTIYKSEQLSLGKTVVIKLLHRHLLNDDTLIKRFHREARAAGRLNHPNVIQIIDFGQTAEGLLYIAMEHVPGQDLAELLHQQFPLEPRRVIRILVQVLNALDEAHAHGVLHRDLKPENIMVADRRNAKDFVKVLDFGIAKLQDTVADANTFQTVAGVVCGTPEYMSPEQARGEELDGRSDLYGVGVILYQMLTNHLPFEGDSALAVVTKHLSERPQPPSVWVPDLPPALERVALNLLAKQQDERLPDAAAVVEELERIDRGLVAEGLHAGAGEPERAGPALAARPAEPEPREGRAVRHATPVSVPAPAASATAAEQESATAPTGTVRRRRAPREVSGRFRKAPAGWADDARVWIVALLVGAAVALAGWFIYRALVPTYRESSARGERIDARPPAPDARAEGRDPAAGAPRVVLDAPGAPGG